MLNKSFMPFGKIMKGLPLNGASAGTLGTAIPAGKIPHPPAKVYKTKLPHAAFKKKYSFWEKRVSGKEIAIFTRQIAATLGAGLLLTESLETIADDMENPYFKDVINNIRADILAGTDFSAALAKYSKIFPVTYTAIVKSGEISGTLYKTMTSLAQFLESSERMKEKVKTAVRYPLFVIGFALLVVLVMVLFLIPKFSVMFLSAGHKLPMLTRIVVGVSEFFLHNFGGIMIAAGFFSVAFAYCLRYPKFRYKVDVCKLHLPLIGKEVIHKALVSRFCRTLSVLLNGGVGLSTSLDISAQSLNHLVIGGAVDRVRHKVLGGGAISEELRNQKVFPRLVAKMVSVGERTGRVDDMLKKTADYYDEELDTTLQNLTALLEPVLIIFVGGIVLIVVLALYLPIFNLATAIR